MARKSRKPQAPSIVDGPGDPKSPAPAQKRGSRKLGCLGIAVAIGVIIIVVALAPSEEPAPNDDAAGVVETSTTVAGAESLESTETSAAEDTATAAPVSTATSQPTATSTTEPTATRVAASRCSTDVPVWLAEAIQTDGELGFGNYVRNFRAVKSEQPGAYLGMGPEVGVWFVAGDLEGASLEGTDEILVWATNLDGVVFSVDYLTAEFSTFPLLSDTDSPISTDTDGYDEAVACAKEASS